MHTPGPWDFAGVMNGTDVVVYRAHGDNAATYALNNIVPPICKIKRPKPGTVHNSATAESDANARLIAAAPDMLRELESSTQKIEQLAEMVNHYAERLGLGKKVNPEDWTDTAHAAIAKATQED